MAVFSNKSVLFTAETPAEHTVAGDALGFDHDKAFSLVAWVKSSTSLLSPIISKYTAADRGYKMELDGSDQVLFTLRSSATNGIVVSDTTGGLRDGAWHLIACTYTGGGAASNVAIYVDGVLRPMATIANDLSGLTTLNAADFTMASNDGGVSGTYTGGIDEVSVWDIALTLTKIQEIYHNGFPDDLSTHSAADDLLAWWRMGDGDIYPTLYNQVLGGTAIFPNIPDESGNGNGGTMTNMEVSDIVADVPRSSFCKYSTYFPLGGNSYYTMGNVHAFEYTDSFSISGWLRFTATTGQLTWVVDKKAGASTYRGYQLLASGNGGRFSFNIISDNATTNKISVETSTGGFNDGEWHHVVVSWSGSATPVAADLRIYVDGVDLAFWVYSDTLTGTIVDSAAFAIGNSVAELSGSAVGRVAEVSVYDKALSLAEAQWIYNAGLPRDLQDGGPSNLVGWWRLGTIERTDQRTRDLVWGAAATTSLNRDMSRFNNDATPTNTEVGDFTSDTPGGDAKFSVDINADLFSTTSVDFKAGYDDHVTMGNASALDFDNTDPFSTSFWVKTTDLGHEKIFGKRQGLTTYRGYALDINVGEYLQFTLCHDSATDDQISVLSDDITGWRDGSWHHICWTVDGSSTAAGVLLYIDGALAGTWIWKDALTGTTLNTEPFRLGCSDWGKGDCFDGTMDEFAVHAKELSAVEVAWIYNSGTPRDLADGAAPSNLVGWWTMGDGDTYPTLSDNSTNSNDGTMTNMAQSDIIGDVPFASSEYLVTPYSGDFGFGSGSDKQWTVGAWIKTTASSGTICYRNSGTSVGPGWGVGMVSGYPLVWWANNYPGLMSMQRSNVRVDDGAWHHILVRRRREQTTGNPICEFYVDNVLTGRVTVQDSNSNNTIGIGGNMVIGAMKSSGAAIGYPFIGKIAEVSVWRGWLTSDQRAAVYNSGAPPNLAKLDSEPDLVGWWKCGDDSGNPGGPVGLSVTSKIGDAPGEEYSVRSLNFDYDGEYVTMGDVLDYERTDAFSISCWFKNDDVGSTDAPISKFQFATPQGWYFQPSNDYQPFFILSNSTSAWIRVSFEYEDFFQDAEWYHVVITYNGSSSVSGVTLYVNGRERQQYRVFDNDLNATIVNSAPLLVAGDRGYGPGEWNGLVDEVSMWGKELSQANVTELYNGGAPEDLTAHSAWVDIDGWWKMGEGPLLDATMVNMLAEDIVTDVPGIIFADETVAASEAVTASLQTTQGAAEIVTISEAVSVTQPLGRISLVVTDQVATGVTLQANLPVELSFSPRNFDATFTSISFTSIDGGVPLQVNRATKEYDVYYTGSSAYFRDRTLSVDEAAARRNLFEASEDFADPYWAQRNGTLESAVVTGPPGYGGLADEFFEDGTPATHHRAAETYVVYDRNGRITVSVFAKKSNRSWLAICIPGWGAPGPEASYFDLENGVTGSTTIHSSYDPVLGISYAGDGWYRCSISVEAPGLDPKTRAFSLTVADGDGGILMDGLNQSSLYVFGASWTFTDDVVPYLRSGEDYQPYAELVLPKFLSDDDFAFFPDNYVDIMSGSTTGLYPIRRVIPDIIDGTAYTILQLKQVLSPLDSASGQVQGLVDDYVTMWTESTPGEYFGDESYVHQYNVDFTTDEDPLTALLAWEFYEGGEFLLSDGFLGTVKLILGRDLNTIEFWVNSLNPPFNPTAVFLITGRTEPKVDWRVISGVNRFVIETTKPTAGKTYELSVESLRTVQGSMVDLIGYLLFDVADVQLPRVAASRLLGDEGTVLVEYDQPMQADEGNLFNIDDYSLVGSTTVTIHQAGAYDETTVALETSGLGVGDYTLTVSTSTPKDIAGNPIDPLWKSAVFTAAAPQTPRSIFTDKGPISKPEETIQSGTGGTITSYTGVTLTGAALSNDVVGKRLRLSGGSTNAGAFRITSVVSATRVLVQAAFILPDTDSHTWEVFDPRHGRVADDPTDVTVRINGSPVTPDAVVGLMGQIVLNAAPGPADDVQVDYNWCCNPTVEIRRLNSREFRLNAWNRDKGYPNDNAQHKYRFNNVLVRPGDYEPLDLRAKLDQPLEREMHYRAYERAYTAVLNDPTLLLLNSPIHRIAYPPAQRFLSESFISYEGIGLPEANVAYPWERVGAGTATSTSGVLTIDDDSTGVYPTGQPIFWTRTVDLTFDHVFAMSWRFSLDVVTTLEGVFTGVVAGYSDENVAAIIGFIDDGGVKKFGVLKRGGTDDPSGVSSWIGGLDVDGNPTLAPVEFDWSILHSYRIYQGFDGVIRVFVDGDIEATLQVTSDELPFLEELNAPFDELQGAFFGSVSRPARSSSSWDFIRYLIQPFSPIQSAPSSFASYEANVPPEQDAKPWAPVGFHGTGTILSSDFLLLDSTSATDATDVGLIGGDFRGYVRFEPLLTSSTEISLDVNLQLQTHTHGPDPDALMFAVDDGSQLMQVAFFPSFSTPKLSYGGRSFPEDFSPYTWLVLGTQPVEMAGRVLRISDGSTTDGKVYYIEDAEPGEPFTSPSSDGRVIASDTDYMLEFRCQVVSYTVDGSGFAGAFSQVFDGSRSVGAMLTEMAGTKYVTFHSDGASTGTQFAFNWGDGLAHTYRLTKSTAGNLISLFVDGAFVGSAAYSSFTATASDPVGQVSFGSSTVISMGAESVVDWSYCNAWRAVTTQKRYVGLWKGHDSDSLLGYHLPLKTSGRGAQAVGNTLQDSNADFVAAGVTTGDDIVVDVGPNRGVYPVASVASGQVATISGLWPQQPTEMDYRIVKETDWSTYHQYRLFRDSTGTVSVLLDTDADPIIQVGYNSLDLPFSGTGIVETLAGDLPAIAWGAFGPEDLSQSSWDFVRYGLTRSVTEMRIAPHHEVQNQWNVMASPEHLFTSTPHDHTDYKSSSTGQPPRVDPDFMADIRENLFTYSEDLENSVWLRTGGSLVANVVSAPEGFDSNADEYTEDGLLGEHRAAYRALDPWSYGATRVTFSTYAKMTGRRWLRLVSHNLPNFGSAWYNLESGAVGSHTFNQTNHAVMGMDDVGGGWYRCWVAFDAPDDWHWFMVAGADADGSTANYTGSGASAFYLFGAQLSRTDAVGEYVKTEANTFIPLEAWTKLNEGTPIVPQTQTWEVRAPYATQEPVSGLNRPEDVLNSDGDFTLNDGALRYKLIIPDDVLYTSLDIIEQQDGGVTDVIAPFCDGCSPHIIGFTYQKDVCLSYDGSVLPEDDAAAPTEWALVSATPGDVSTSAFAGALTYSTSGGKTVYRNDTPLPDGPSLQTEARFRIKLLNDWSGGTDDTQVRFGLSAPGMTLALAFVTISTGERFVLVLDQNNGAVVGAVPFDFLDGLYHDYRIVRDPSVGTVQVFIDS